MKIAIVSEHASALAARGGADCGPVVYVSNVARQLARGGHQVDVFTRRDHPHQPEAFHWEDNLRVLHVNAGPAQIVPGEDLLPCMELFGERLGTLCRRQDRPYDVLHASFFMSGLAALQAAERAHIPLVMTFHALGKVHQQHRGEPGGFPEERFDIEERLLREADRVLAESPQCKRDMLALYDADPRRIDVVPSGFDPAQFRPMRREEARDRLGWPRGAFIVLQLGRMAPRTGADTVVRAIAALRRDHGLEAQLHVVGGNSEEPDFEATPELGRLARIADEEGVRGQVRFVGRRGREDLPLLYGACDVFAATPWHEPSGITAIEAMACARPVVAIGVGGAQYSVSDGESGFLVPPKDASALAARLAMLQADPMLGRRMGAAGLARARRLFTWSRVARSIALCYRRAISPPRSAPAPLRARGFAH